jgi:ribonuclease HII
LAGPVFAAAVILNPDRPIAGLRDSKVLSERQRESLAGMIREHALAWAIAEASVAEIDRLNILQATMLAMQRAVTSLAAAPKLALVDGNRAPNLPCSVRTVVRGDASEPAISAASILAKTARDAAMLELHKRYAAYGFDQHKGYPSPLHLRRLNEHGPCPEHRSQFGPVQAVIAARSLRVDSAS